MFDRVSRRKRFVVGARMTRNTDAEGRGPFRVVATSAVFLPGYRGGGPIRSVAHILDTLPEDIDLRLLTSDRDLGEMSPYPGLSGRWIPRGRSRIFYLDVRNSRQWWKVLRELRSGPIDLLYVNSLWQPVFTLVPMVALRLGILRSAAVLIAPRGELSPGALTLKGRKKHAVLRILRPLLRSLNVNWHASTALERTHIRGNFPGANVYVNSNQSSLPLEPLGPATLSAMSTRIVFIGRVSPKKNLRLLIESLGDIGRGIALDIYGPLEDRQYWQDCLRTVINLPPNITVMYCGELAHSDVRETFATYDAFAFPTLGENFGHVIAESLSASCPVICSDQTPWSDVLRGGGGIVLAGLSRESLTRALAEFAACSPMERQKRRVGAGDTYRTWRLATEPQSHIFDAVRATHSST